MDDHHPQVPSTATTSLHEDSARSHRATQSITNHCRGHYEKLELEPHPHGRLGGEGLPSLMPTTEPATGPVEAGDLVTDGALLAEGVDDVDAQSVLSRSIGDETDDDRPVVYTVFGPRKKAFIVVILSLAGVLAPLSSSMYLPALQTIEDELETTATMVSLTITVYMLGLGVAPLFWASISDVFGRRLVYMASFVVFILACVGNAMSNSIGMLLGMRVIQSCGASSVIAVGAGSICDLYETKRRGRALGFFFLGALIGPVIGPIIGGYVTSSIGWRWTFWILAIFGGIVLLLITFVLPETHRRIVAEKYQARMVNLPLKPTTWVVNPLLPLYYLKYPYVALTIINISILYGALYAMSTSMPANYSDVYGLSTDEVGLTFLAMGVGNILGSVAGGNFADFILARKRKMMEREFAMRQAEEDGGVSSSDATYATEVITANNEKLINLETPTSVDGTTKYHSAGTDGEGAIQPANKFDAHGATGTAITATNTMVGEPAASAAIEVPKEFRLTGGILFFWLMPTSMLFYGWFLHSHQPLAATLTIQFFGGLGMTFIFASYSTYLVDIFTTRSATITSLNNSVRSIWAAVCSVIVVPMESGLGPGWTFTIFSLLQFGGGLIMIIVFLYGHRWRQRWPPASK
ncbi:hypothetical protein IWQ60_006227 [Tieghemiomyces parasiticus]|uniref:Major facilitator superfamily (MFS) profile domain-containing protein n=1 Tax=Tieghemiomyces parasiticus TaxID=78921 RepID=A0A9W8A7Q2_9FUNG|nr:hypothetical protein IWQ60_006227 [Tieghemiomyces parasiticus]